MVRMSTVEDFVNFTDVLLIIDMNHYKLKPP